MTIEHNIIPTGERHPLHDFAPATIAVMQATTVTDDDIGKQAKVTTPLSTWELLEQTSGVGRWVLKVLADWPTASTEIDTGRELDGSRIYLQRFTGANASATLISGGIDKCVAVEGYVGATTSRFIPATYSTLGGTTDRYWVEVDGSNNLVATLSGTFFTGNHDLLVWYTKT